MVGVRKVFDTYQCNTSSTRTCHRNTYYWFSSSYGTPPSSNIASICWINIFSVLFHSTAPLIQQLSVTIFAMVISLWENQSLWSLDMMGIGDGNWIIDSFVWGSIVMVCDGLYPFVLCSAAFTFKCMHFVNLAQCTWVKCSSSVSNYHGHGALLGTLGTFLLVSCQTCHCHDHDSSKLLSAEYHCDNW